MSRIGDFTQIRSKVVDETVLRSDEDGANLRTCHVNISFQLYTLHNIKCIITLSAPAAPTKVL